MKNLSQLSHKENHRRVSSPSKTIVLNETSLEREESFLLDQSTSSTLTHELNLDPSTNIENIRSKNPNRLIIAQLNINSLRYKFDSLVEILRSNVDILLISETKIDSSFPTAQFKIEGYTTYRLDRNSNGGSILLYIREDIPSTLLNTELLIEGFCIEINIRKKKWLLVCTYNPNKNLILNHFKEIGKNLDNYTSKYDNFILLGDLNSAPTEAVVRDFCQIYGCKNLIKDNTCFKNPEKRSCIDLIITNRPKSFQNSMTLETGLTNFHQMTLTVMKVFYKKQKPTIITYRRYKIFSNEVFMADFQNTISQVTFENNDLEFDIFKAVLNQAIQKHAPIKQRYVRENQTPFINKTINKEIMKRSRLRNKFLNTKSDIDRKAYNKQRNLCVSLIRREKKNFFKNISTRDITDIKTFWKTVKPLFTDKIQTKSKITLIEKKVVSGVGKEQIVSEKVISEDQPMAEVFNKFFINIVPNLKIPTNHNYDTDFVVTKDQVANALNKFRNHPSIIVIKNKRKADQCFSFGSVTYEDILKKNK